MTDREKYEYTKENKEYIESMTGEGPEKVKEILKKLNPYMLPYQEQNNRWWLADDERGYYYQIFARYSIISYDDFTEFLKKLFGEDFNPQQLANRILANHYAKQIKKYYEAKYNRILPPQIYSWDMKKEEIDNANVYVELFF